MKADRVNANIPGKVTCVDVEELFNGISGEILKLNVKEPSVNPSSMSSRIVLVK
jgi:hypothetical protein